MNKKLKYTSCFIIISFIKVYFGITHIFDFFYKYQGGHDANYYHDYAVGINQVATTSWPVFLRALNEYGLYSRVYLTLILILLASYFIPLMIAKVSTISKCNKNNNDFIKFAILASLYPAMFYCSLDILRDIVMISIFIFAVFIAKEKLIYDKSYIYYVFFIMLGLVLFSLRQYLGFSVIISLFLYPAIKRIKLLYLVLTYFIFVYIANYFNVFDSLIEYRQGFEIDGVNSSTTLGIDLSSSSVITFLPLFSLSLLSQLFGFYFVNLASISVFILESVPFIISFFYVMLNSKYHDDFIRFVLVFFAIYSTIWIIGNDNLGTAVRLRIYSYISIYISAFIIYRKKKSN